MLGTRTPCWAQHGLSRHSGAKPGTELRPFWQGPGSAVWFALQKGFTEPSVLLCEAGVALPG